MNATYGLFKNGKSPETAEPAFITNAATWGIAVQHFAGSNFGGGAVYNLKTGKYIATVANK